MQSTPRVLSRRAMLLGIGLVLVLLALVPSALAWNKAGHMVSGAIAYADLKQASPQTLVRVIALLKAHAHFEANVSSHTTTAYMVQRPTNWCIQREHTTDTPSA